MSNKNNLSSFVKELNHDKEKVLTKVNDVIKGTGEAVHESLFMEPGKIGVNVDTGHLASNYIVSIDSERSGVVGSKESVDTSVQNSAWAEFLQKEDLYNHKSIYFNNDVSYGPTVNALYNNFKEKAIQAGNEYLKRHLT